MLQTVHNKYRLVATHGNSNIAAVDEVHAGGRIAILRCYDLRDAGYTLIDVQADRDGEWVSLGEAFAHRQNNDWAEQRASFVRCHPE